MTELPPLSFLSHDEQDALIRALWAQVQALTARGAELAARLGEPAKNSANSRQPPSQDGKANRAAKPQRPGPRQGSLGRKGGGRALSANPDETVIARPVYCVRCQAVFAAADHKLVDRYDKIELPQVTPVVTRVELLRRTPPGVRHHHAGAAAGGPGARQPVRHRHRGPGAVSALNPRDQLPAVEQHDAGTVRPGDQRGRAGWRLPTCQAAAGCRGRRDPVASAACPRGVFR